MRGARGATRASLGRFAGSNSAFAGAARPVLTPLMACLNQKPPHAVCLP